MECEVERQSLKMADNQGESCRESEQQQQQQQAKCDDLDDIDVEAILSRVHCGRRRHQQLYEAPEFVKRLNSYEEVKVGSTVVFACQWRALPKPTVKWYKDDDEITENNRYKFQLVDDNVEQIVIEDCKRNDEGAYKCKAENQDGVASTTGYLSVTGPAPGEGAVPPHSQSDHCISVPPPRGLRTIVEQKSLEEREEVEYSHLPPSPIQDFIDTFTARRGHTWPYAQLGYTPEDFAYREQGNGEDSGSDTSVESQEYDHVTFEARSRDDIDDDIDDELDDTRPLVEGGDEQSDVSPPVVYNNSHTAPFSSSESETSSSDVSIPEINVETVSRHRRKRTKRLPLQRTTAVEMEDHAQETQKELNKLPGRSPKVGSEEAKKDAQFITNGLSLAKAQIKTVGVPEFTVAKVSKVALVSFTAADTNTNKKDFKKDLVNNVSTGSTKKTSVEKAQNATVPKSSSEKALSSTQDLTLQGILGVNFVDMMERVMDSPLLYYILFTCCCGLLGMATEVPILFYVLAVGLMALVSFRLLLHRT